MTVPIVDDVKAIRDRMREIEAERSGKSHCPVCKDTGWMLDFSRARFRGYSVCFVCHNPVGRPRPLDGEDKVIGRTASNAKR